MKKKILRIIKIKWVRALAVFIVAAAVLIPTGLKLKNDYQRFSAKNPIPLSDIFIKKTDREKIHLTAHRGFSCQAPENTVPAIEKAAQYGFDSIEIDVRQTQDGVWVLSHDSKVDDTTNKKGKISSYTYYDLVTCKINRGANHKDYDNLTIPTFEQALKVCLEHNIRPMIEIKDYTDDGIKNLLSIIEKNGFTQSCQIISFDRNVLNLIHDENDKIELVALINVLSKSSVKECLDYPYIGVSFNGEHPLNTQAKINQLQAAGIKLYAWAIDDAENMQELYKIGITNFVTNRIYK
jgi:glycerophosphoryl diester phosphodiesterase